MSAHDRTTFPHEILDEIMTYLADDRTTLAQCSLASSKLCQICRSHLFKSVILDARTFASFIGLMNASWSSIPPALSKVTIRGKIRGGDHWETFGGFMDFTKLKSRLRRVQTLSVLSICLDDVPLLLWGLFERIAGIKEVHVQNVVFQTSAQFFRFLCSLPSLKKLTVLHPICAAALPGSKHLRTLQPKTRLSIPLLDVGTQCDLQMFEWLLEQDPIPYINTLRVDISKNRFTFQRNRLLRFLSATGIAVRNLQIELPHLFHGRGSLYKELFDLTTLTSLRTVQIKGLLIDPLCCPEDKVIAESTLLHLLSHLPRLDHHRLSLSLQFSVDDSSGNIIGMPDNILVKMYNWKIFTEPLLNYPGLDLTLKFACYPAYLNSCTEEFLRAGPFAPFQDSGGFHVEFSESNLMEANIA